MSIEDSICKFATSIETLAASLERIADAINGANVTELKTFENSELKSGSSDSKKAKKKAESKKEEVGEAEEALTENDNSDLRKIMRQELKRVVMARGEAVGEKLLKKYGAREINEVDVEDIPDFMVDANELIEKKPSVTEKSGKKAGKKAVEIDFDTMKNKFVHLLKLRGSDAISTILDSFEVKKLSELEESSYLNAYNMAVKALEG